MSSLLGVVCFALLGLSGCGGNNIGALFDPDRGGNGDGDATGRVVVEAGGRVADGRPSVVNASPTSGGWPTTVPVVIVFDESLDPTSVEGQGGGGGVPGVPQLGGGGVFLRVEGTEQPLPGSVDLIRGGTTVVIRPAAALDATVTYEICVDPEVRDVDGLRYGGSAVDVVGTFRADRADTVTEGRIVTTLPRDNERDVPRGEDVFVVFDRPVDPTTVTTASLILRDATGMAIDGNIELPLEVAGTPDPRIVRVRPTDGLLSAATHEVVVDATITFTNGGILDFSGRTPFTSFTTQPHNAPTAIEVGGAAPEFPGKINATNLSSVTLDVSVDDSVPAGAEIRLRVYGLEPSTQAENDLEFEELEATTAEAGPTTVQIAVGSLFGTLSELRFDEGPLRLRAEVLVDDQSSGFATPADDDLAAIDVTPPVISELLPGVPDSSMTLATDLGSLVLHGVADGPLGAAELTAGGVTAELFAADADGRFVLTPLPIDPMTVQLPYTLALTDSAGNSASAALGGDLLSRGKLGGQLTDTLMVCAYDETTGAPIAGATVVLEPMQPTNPATGQQIATTDAAGVVTFTGLGAAPNYTFTVVADGFDLLTIVECAASFASVPLTPTAADAATGSLDVTTAFVPTSGVSVLLGGSTFADAATQAVQSEVSTALEPPTTPIRAGRPVVITALSGTFPPTASPAFGNFGCEMCGVDLMTPTPPAFGPAGGVTVERALGLLPAALGLVSAQPYSLDFAAATGLGTLAAEPTVLATLSMDGLAGNGLFGVGFATLDAGASYTVQCDVTALPLASLASFATRPRAGGDPFYWLSVQGEDTDGAISRHRSLFDPLIGVPFVLGGPPAIPVVTPPSGTASGAPLVQFADALDESVTFGTGRALWTIVARDSAGRSWRVISRDQDVAGGVESVQLPVLGSAATGLATGNWQVSVEATLFADFVAVTDPWQFQFEEVRRNHLTWARSASVTVPVQ